MKDRGGKSDCSYTNSLYDQFLSKASIPYSEMLLLPDITFCLPKNLIPFWAGVGWGEHHIFEQSST